MSILEYFLNWTRHDAHQDIKVAKMLLWDLYLKHQRTSQHQQHTIHTHLLSYNHTIAYVIRHFARCLPTDLTKRTTTNKMRSTTFFILVFLGLTAATALPQLEQDRRCAGGVIVCQKGTNQRCWKNCSLRQCHCPDDATNRSCDTDFAKDDFCGDCKDGWHDFYEAQGLGQKAYVCGKCPPGQCK